MTFHFLKYTYFIVMFRMIKFLSFIQASIIIIIHYICPKLRSSLCKLLWSFTCRNALVIFWTIQHRLKSVYEMFIKFINCEFFKGLFKHTFLGLFLDSFFCFQRIGVFGRAVIQTSWNPTISWFNGFKQFFSLLLFLQKQLFVLGSKLFIFINFWVW